MKIRKHSKGSYYTTFRKRFIYGSTPEEVEQKYYEIRYKASRGHDVTKNPTMEAYMIKWFNAYKKGEGALKTQEMYRNCVNNHINPALGSKKVKEVTSTDVQTFIKSITSSKSLAHKVRITLNQIFKAAVADKIIDFHSYTPCFIPACVVAKLWL
jgi:integrase